MDGHSVELTVNRTLASRVDRLRDYRVMVDGKEVARVANGASISVPVSEGEHVVWLKIDWCRSPKLTVRAVPGQPLVLNAGPNVQQPAFALVYVTALRHRYIWLIEAARESGSVAA